MAQDEDDKEEDDDLEIGYWSESDMTGPPKRKMVPFSTRMDSYGI